MAKYKKDIILTALILLSFLVFWLIRVQRSNADVHEAEVYVDGVLVRTIDLTVDDEFRVDTPNGYNVISVVNGKVAVIEADCDGGDCVKTGYISGSNGYIACLPHGLLISPKSDNKYGSGGTDAVAY